jgi:hypothetical protein
VEKLTKERKVASGSPVNNYMTSSSKGVRSSYLKNLMVNRSQGSTSASESTSIMTATCTGHMSMAHGQVLPSSTENMCTMLTRRNFLAWLSLSTWMRTSKVELPHSSLQVKRLEGLRQLECDRELDLFYVFLMVTRLAHWFTRVAQLQAEPST